MINIQAKYALAIRHFVSTEETRYYLNGFFVTPCETGDGVLIVATDGHRLGIFHDETGKCTEPAIVKLNKDMLRQLKTPAKEHGERRLNVPGMGHAEIFSFDNSEVGDVIAMQQNATIDATFPDWRRILPEIPESEVNPSAGFNANFIGGFTAMAKDLGHKQAVILMRGRLAADPHLVFVSQVPEFIGVLMPCFVDMGNAIPMWLQAKGSAKKNDEIGKEAA